MQTWLSNGAAAPSSTHAPLANTHPSTPPLTHPPSQVVDLCARLEAGGLPRRVAQLPLSEGLPLGLDLWVGSR